MDIRLIRTLFLLSLLISPISSLLAQSGGEGGDLQPMRTTSGSSLRPDGVALLAKGYGGDSVVLRWGPTTPAAWLDGNRFGYVVERIRIDNTTPEEAASETLTPTPIKPWGLEEWERRIGPDTSRRWAAVAVQVLWGESVGEEDISGPSNIYTAMQRDATNLANRHGFALFAADLDATAADGLALRFVDRNVDPEGRYAYRVFIAGLDTTIASSYDTAYAVVNMPDLPFDPEPIGVNAVGGDRQIRIAWSDEAFAGFSGYWIEREESSGSWRRLNNLPIVRVDRSDESTLVEPSDSAGDGAIGFGRDRDVTVGYTDTNVINGQTYRYRVRGANPFAEVSDGVIVEASPHDMTPPPSPTGVASEEIGDGEVRLTWQMTDPPTDLAGFRIVRGATDTGPFREVTDTPLSPSTREYLVPDADEAEAYYQVVAVDTADNRTGSHIFLAEAIDRTPPSAPLGVRGVIDSSGMITISWRANPESDIRGYQVYFANDTTHEFSLLTNDPIADTIWLDTLRIQNADKRVYYRVVALDRRLNRSPHSKIAGVAQPDVIPPDAPAMRNITSTDSSVVLRWGRATAADIEYQLVLRAPATGGDFEEIARLDPTVDRFEDTSVVPEVIYHYALMTLDDSGLPSEPSAITYAGAYDITPPDGVEDFIARFDAEEWRVELSWSYREEKGEELRRFVLYRAGLDGNLERFSEVDPSDRLFIDADISSEPVWKYALRVETSGGESALSDVQVVPVR